MYKSQNKILNKFVENLLKYRIMFKDKLTFLGIYYRNASHITLYFVVQGISIPKSDQSDDYIT